MVDILMMNTHWAIQLFQRFLRPPSIAQLYPGERMAGKSFEAVWAKTVGQRDGSPCSHSKSCPSTLIRLGMTAKTDEIAKSFPTIR